MSSPNSEIETRLEINPDVTTAQQRQSLQENSNDSNNNNNTTDSSSNPENLPLTLSLQSKTTSETSGNNETIPSTTSTSPTPSVPNPLEFNVQDLKCPICMDLFIEPETTDCAHTFCHYCINVWFANSPIRGRNICPQCRAIIHRTIPAQELSTKVEEYVVAHLSKELQDERESTKQNRRQESVNWRNRGRNSNRGQRQGAQVNSNYDDVDAAFWSYTVNSYRVPPTENSRSRTRSRSNNNNVNNNNNRNNNMPGLLNEFEFRLDRAQRSYALIVSASREMNHQLEHLRNIAHRLERHERLLNRNRRNSSSFEENNNSDNNDDTFTFSNNNDSTFNTNNDNDLSNLLVTEPLDEINNSATNNINQNHQNNVNYHYTDPYAMWNWLAAPSQQQHYNGPRFYHPQTLTEINLASTMNPHFYPSSMYGYSDPTFNTSNTSSESTVNDSYPLTFHAQYQGSNEQNGSTGLVGESGSTTTTTGSASRVRARRRNFPYSGHRQPHHYHHPHCPHSNGNIDRHLDLDRHDSGLQLDEEDYLNQLTNQLADHDIAEAIERSLVMDILEPQVEVSLRSSRIRSRPSESGAPRRRINNHHDMTNLSEDSISPLDLVSFDDNDSEERRERTRHYSSII